MCQCIECIGYQPDGVQYEIKGKRPFNEVSLKIIADDIVTAIKEFRSSIPDGNTYHIYSVKEVY